jgi:hypothetical protein
MNEELVLLEEQLASAEANIEQLQARLAGAEALASGRAGELGELRRRLGETEAALAQRDDQSGAQAAEIESLRQAVLAADERARAASHRYRDAVLDHEPDLPADLVAGDTVEEVEASLTRARQTVAQVRQHLEQRAQLQRVPAGAPARGAPDHSALSPADKIRLGLNGG